MKFKACLVAMFVWLGLFAALPACAEPLYQLRIYQLFDNNKAEFHARFRDQALPIMAKYGFDIVFMSEAQGEKGPEFVYLLRWPDADTRDMAWKAFKSDADWIAIKKDSFETYGAMTGDIIERNLILTDYTPPPSLVP